MRIRFPLSLFYAACMVLLFQLFTTAVNPAVSGELGWQRKIPKNPYIREALFDLYKGRFASGIGHLRLERRRGVLTNETDTADILLAYLYILYNMHNQASNLLDNSSSMRNLEDRQTLRLEIAKFYLRNGLISSAKEELMKIGQDLSTKRESEKLVLEAQIHSSSGRPQLAINTLLKIQNNDIWGQFGKYNLGITLINTGNIARGVAQLENITAIQSTDVELSALIDKTNYTIGLLHLSKKNPLEAKKYFDKIRIKGPFSNQALYALGTALSDLKEYKKALGIFMELASRDPSDPVVLAAMLAIPAHFVELGGYNQSIDYYQKSIEQYNKEISAIDATINSVKQGPTLQAVVDVVEKSKLESDPSSLLLPNLKVMKYLHNLFTNYPYLQLMQNYSELRNMESKLSIWMTTIKKNKNASQIFKKIYLNKLQTQRTTVSRTLGRMEKHIIQVMVKELVTQKQKLRLYVKSSLSTIALLYDKVNNENTTSD